MRSLYIEIYQSVTQVLRPYSRPKHIGVQNTLSGITPDGLTIDVCRDGGVPIF